MRELLLGPVLCATVSLAQLDQGIDFSGCFKDLDRADLNRDGFVKKNEYLRFIQEYGKRVCFSTDTLTLSQHRTFSTLACICRSQEGYPADCCVGKNAQIPTAGALQAIEAQTPNQRNFLHTVCRLTDATIDGQCASVTPATAVVLSPTTSPTMVPTRGNTTMGGGIGEPAVTTASPNPAPTAAPTSAPLSVAPTTAAVSLPIEGRPEDGSCDGVFEATFTSVLFDDICTEVEGICPASCTEAIGKAHQACEGKILTDTVTNEVAKYEPTFLLNFGAHASKPCESAPVDYLLSQNDKLNCNDWMNVNLGVSVLFCSHDCTDACKMIIDNVYEKCAASNLITTPKGNSFTAEEAELGTKIFRNEKCNEYASEKKWEGPMSSALSSSMWGILSAGSVLIICLML